MDQDGPRGIVRRRGLTVEEIVQAERLAELCNRLEGLELAVNLAAEGAFPGVEIDQFLYYEDGALVGFWSVDPGREPEVCGMVHPEHRRRGIGCALLTAAREACRERGYRSWLLVTEAASRSGQAFVEAMGADYGYSEYRMELLRDAVPDLPPQEARFRLRPATATDVDSLARLLGASFGDSEPRKREEIARQMQEPRYRFYLATLDQEPIGTMRLHCFDPAVYLTAFSVLPEHRGRGYGRQILMQTIRTLLTENWERILIEVVTNNWNALSLYRSCGFRETTSYGYYHMAL